MSLTQKIIVKTADTNETVEYPDGPGWGEYWQVGFVIKSIDQYGNPGLSGSPKFIHVTRQTLVNCGLLPASGDDAPPPVAVTKENAEALLLNLLALVGVHPNE